MLISMPVCLSLSALTARFRSTCSKMRASSNITCVYKRPRGMCSLHSTMTAARASRADCLIAQQSMEQRALVLAVENSNPALQPTSSQSLSTILRLQDPLPTTYSQTSFFHFRGRRCVMWLSPVKGLWKMENIVSKQTSFRVLNTDDADKKHIS